VVLMVFQWKFFKALIPCKDDSVESSENISNISSGFKCSQSHNQSYLEWWIFQNHGIMNPEFLFIKRAIHQIVIDYRGISFINNGL